MNNAEVLARGSVVIRLSTDIADDRDRRNRRAIDRLWNEARATQPHLHDGTILSVDAWNVSSSGVTVEVQSRPYRSYVAQRHGTALGVRPLGVSGACEVVPGRWLVGKRSSKVTDYQGFWELVPSGSLDPKHIDPTTQLRKELAEEVGVPLSEPAEATTLGLIRDDAGVFDIVVHLRFGTKPMTNPSSEYDQLVDLGRQGLLDLVSELCTVPTVGAIAELLP